jgi:ribosomal protein S18
MRRYKEKYLIDENLLKEGYFANINNDPVLLYHKNLKNLNEDSKYKKECPFCEYGILLVMRKLETFEIQESDVCTICCQKVKYIDYKEIDLY